jgi:hypothetical protein
MIFDDPTLTRLLGSIEANRLVLLCGAGLSIPPPSDLMSAIRVSQECYERYRHIKVLPAAMRDDIGKLAGHFYGTAEFESVFIGSLVPWNELVGQPNDGHAAVADFLVSRAATAALSANFDTLIEQWAQQRKIAMRGALDGHEAREFSNDTSPLVKFHGCHFRDRKKTLWTDGQLAEPTVADRVATCSKWMELELPGKDLLVVGFWTDWGYLNDVLANALNVNAFGSVTVVNPETSAALQAKAPSLWARLNGNANPLQHLQASGADALTELRVAFSKGWIRKFYALGKPLLEADGKTYSAIEPDMNCEDLYNSRCDAEGLPYNRAARMKQPPPQSGAAAFFHLLLVGEGAAREGAQYTHKGKRIRVVQGAGQALNTVRQGYRESAALPQPDFVVCAGALDLATPGRIISSGAGASIVRPAVGGSAQWMTLEKARGELGI